MSETYPQRSTNEWAALDHAHVWHPFTPMQQWRQEMPLVIDRAQGDFLYDTDGNRYIDGVSSLWCTVHGHRVEAIDNAIRDQLNRVAHTTLLGLASPPSIELAKRLSDTAPDGLTKTFYSDAGATALELAFKMAVGYWYHKGQPDKRRFIGLQGAYHGDTTGSMSVGFSDLFHRAFAAMVFPTHYTPTPDASRAPEAVKANAAQHDSTPIAPDTIAGYEASWMKQPHWPSEDPALQRAHLEHCFAEFEKLLEQHAGEVAAVVIEPVMQGAAGMVCQPPGYVAGLVERARQHDVLVIADEVATGFGRTGTLFACEREGIAPDILCLAKGITGGYLPLAATMVTDEIEQAFCGELADRRTLYHGHTYTGNPLACAAALASLNLFEKNDLLTTIRQHAAKIGERLHTLRDCPHVLDVRQRGLMVGIELCRDRATAKPFDFAARTGAQLCKAMRRKGVIARPLGDVIILMPIPAMQPENLDKLLDVVVGTIMDWQWDV